MNRSHMIDDHHGGTAARATLPVRAMDEILGTHKSSALIAVATIWPGWWR